MSWVFQGPTQRLLSPRFKPTSVQVREALFRERSSEYNTWRTWAECTGSTSARTGEWALLLSLLKLILPLLGPYSLKSHSSCNEELIQELALPFFCKHCPCCQAAEVVWREILTATGEILFFPSSSPWALLTLCYLLATSQWAETNSQSGTLLKRDVI